MLCLSIIVCWKIVKKKLIKNGNGKELSCFWEEQARNTTQYHSRASIKARNIALRIPSSCQFVWVKNRKFLLIFSSHKEFPEFNVKIFLPAAQETEAVRKQYVKIADAYGCLGVLQLNAGESKNILYLVMVTGCFSIGKIADCEIFRITQTQFVSLQHQQPAEDKISEVRKVLNSGE